MIKHLSIYLDPDDSEVLLSMIAYCESEFKVTYQSYDWSLNC